MKDVPSLLIASRNRHKIDEFADLLAPLGVTVRGLDAFPDAPEVEEDGATFEANAIKKAVQMAAYSGTVCLSDDSGLEVKVLHGAPGVHSARYAGVHGDDAANNRRLLRELEGAGDRSARFVCVLALAWPDGRHLLVRGECPGHIATEARGQGGFGYDPLFVPDGYAESFASLGSDVKASISHRARAFQKAVSEWGSVFS